MTRANQRPSHRLGSVANRVALISMAAVLGGCGAPAQSSPPMFDLAPATVSLPPGKVFGLAWLNDGWLVTNYRADPEGVFGNIRLWRFRPDGSDFAEIDLPEDRNCRLLGYFRPVALSDGRLGYVRECAVLGRDPGVEMDAALGSVDLRTGRTELLAPVASGVGDSGIASFDWDPTIGAGLISIGSGICQGIEWIDQAGPRPIDLVISDGDHQLNLADEFRRPSTDCSATGTADGPARSWKDGAVAFFASPASVGTEGQARLDAPSSLYIADPELKTASPRLNGIQPRSGLAWSPDGRWLAFAGKVKDLGEGAWLFDTTSSTLRRFSRLDVGEMAWSPDGLRIAAIEQTTDLDRNRRIDLFDVSGLLADTQP